MGKNKKKKDRKKIEAVVPDDLFEVAAQSVKQFRKVTNEIARLSLGQKLVGSLVLVAAGLIYLDQRRPDDNDQPRRPPQPNWLRLPEAAATQEAEEEPAQVLAAPKSRKSTKPRKAHGHASRKPADDTHTG